MSASRFRTLYRYGSRNRSGGITVLQTPQDSVVPEVGFVAGKKVGNAVARNRAKRRLREATRRISLPPGSAYLFIATKEVVDAPFDDVVTWLEEAVREPAMSSLNV